MTQPKTRAERRRELRALYRTAGRAQESDLPGLIAFAIMGALAAILLAHAVGSAGQ
jgi:hypothetical protein